MHCSVAALGSHSLHVATWFKFIKIKITDGARQPSISARQLQVAGGYRCRRANTEHCCHQEDFCWAVLLCTVFSCCHHFSQSGFEHLLYAWEMLICQFIQQHTSGICVTTSPLMLLLVFFCFLFFFSNWEETSNVKE